MNKVSKVTGSEGITGKVTEWFWSPHRTALFPLPTVPTDIRDSSDVSSQTLQTASHRTVHSHSLRTRYTSTYTNILCFHENEMNAIGVDKCALLN